MTISHYRIFQENGITVRKLEVGDTLLTAIKKEDASGIVTEFSEARLISINQRASEPTSLWILRVGDYGLDWRYIRKLYMEALESGDFEAYHKGVEQMESRETNPNNHNFFANNILVHNK